MMVFVTGASGHLGAHLIRLLIKEGYAVRAFVRLASSLTAISHLDIDIRKGNLLDDVSVQQAMEGCEAVFHLAAPTRTVSGLREAIITGTENVLCAASRCGVSTVVYTSSIVTIGYSSDPTIVLNESNQTKSSASPYHAAKFLAEQSALLWAQKGGFRLVVVNPATIVGALDYRVTPSSEVIQRALTAGLPFAFDSGLTIAPVRDAAMGHILALRHGRNGERYILGGERITIPDYFRVIEEFCGRQRECFRLPRSVMVGMGAAFSAAKVFGKKKIPFTFRQAQQLVGRYGFYSSEKAARELGYRWKPAKYAIADYIEWVRAGRPCSID